MKLHKFGGKMELLRIGGRNEPHRFGGENEASQNWRENETPQKWWENKALQNRTGSLQVYSLTREREKHPLPLNKLLRQPVGM